ncbi:MAG: peptide chain release factor N(5)-glutamine methyltransferase [Bacteroidales bacterium]|nr:peptide chain release factor N(5)-glutamine methyltransferase [Bacteroidales bacterium]
MMIRNIYKQHLSLLSKLYDKNEAESILRLLYESVLEKQLGLLLMENNEIQEQQQILDVYFRRLMNNEPIQYILNKAHFYGREFYVDKNVLIPRNETEELVKLILDSEKTDEKLKVLDIGTGSGCIPITLDLESENFEVSGMDISEEALNVARRNMKHLGVDIDFFYGDVFLINDSDWRVNMHIRSHDLQNFSQPEIFNSELKTRGTELFDIIVSNPPYILEKEKSLMKKNVLDYEPELALFVPNDDGLKYYKAIIDALPFLLKDTGRLYLEINNLFAEEIITLLKQYFNGVTINKDFRGNDRFVAAKGVKS